MARERLAQGIVAKRILDIHTIAVKEKGNPPLNMDDFVIDASLFQGNGAAQ
jgi:hypothetical protein